MGPRDTTYAPIARTYDQRYPWRERAPSAPPASYPGRFDPRGRIRNASAPAGTVSALPVHAGGRTAEASASAVAELRYASSRLLETAAEVLEHPSSHERQDRLRDDTRHYAQLYRRIVQRVGETPELEPYSPSRVAREVLRSRPSSAIYSPPASPVSSPSYGL